MLQPVSQGFATDVPHCKEMVALVFANEMNGNNIGMLDPRGRLSFGFKALDEILLAGQFGGQHLDRNSAVQVFFVTLVNVTNLLPASTLSPVCCIVANVRVR